AGPGCPSPAHPAASGCGPFGALARVLLDDTERDVPPGEEARAVAGKALAAPDHALDPPVSPAPGDATRQLRRGIHGKGHVVDRGDRRDDDRLPDQGGLDLIHAVTPLRLSQHQRPAAVMGTDV